MYDIAPMRPAPPPVRAGGGVARQHNRALQRVDQQAEVAQRQIEGIHQVARAGMFETMQTGLARRAAELMVPDQAEILQAINIAAGFGTVGVINGMYRG